MPDKLMEMLAAQYDNVVLYAEDGTPGIFVKFPKMKSSDLDPSLPNHTHPAFIVNGVEQDYILLGKFKAGCSNLYGEDTSVLTSLPGLYPASGLGESAFLSQMRAFGQGVSGMTAADRGLLLLLAQKHGWKPGGNNAQGHCTHDAPLFYWGCQMDPSTGKYLYHAGDRVGYKGWLYECATEHERSLSIRPDEQPSHWKKLKWIGGIQIGNHSVTMNGSGPMSWYLDGTAGSVCDLLGNLAEADYGYRVVGGELQILPDNDAASPDADLSETSTAWRAILPSQTDDSYTLVDPGTTGTLHWSAVHKSGVGSSIALDIETPDIVMGGHEETAFCELTALSDHLPYVPCIVRELGLLPTTGSTTEGLCVVHYDSAIRPGYRGCAADGEYTDGMGMGQSLLGWTAEEKHPYQGARQRAMMPE